MFHVQPPDRFDVVVVGGGHAGIEAALACARLGRRTALISLTRFGIGRMPCNPAIGGQAKGHLVREIDALGGAIARVADASTIQFKHLNTRRGLAVRASRAQVDRHLYQARMRQLVHETPGLWVGIGEVVAVDVQDGQVVGVRLADGVRLVAPAVVVTTGTFLRGALHTGQLSRRGGGGGEPSAAALSASLAAIGHRIGRLKTGTVPRLDARTIDWDALPVQEGDRPGLRFSFVGPPSRLPQVRCRLTATDARAHEIVRQGLRHSPMYGDAPQIEGVGPRYCPSIEDKVLRFADKETHRIVLEPEGLATWEVYPNGLSTSLPTGVQARLVRSMPGLGAARILRPGYAIEYDYADPRDLGPDLQSRFVGGLFLAGQINGTTGYEEAAAQGLWAGLQAARRVAGEAPAVLGRDEAYLAVLVDDLIRRGADEPYRMFTSRAEWRLLLREDNADLRLTPRGRAWGLVGDSRWRSFEARRSRMASAMAWAKGVRVDVGSGKAAVEASGAAAPRIQTTLAELLQRPEADWTFLVERLNGPRLPEEDAEAVEVELRYAGYLARQRADVQRLHAARGAPLRPMVYQEIPGLRPELAERLTAAMPTDVAAAEAIPGMTPAALALLLAWSRRASTGGQALGRRSAGPADVAAARLADGAAEGAAGCLADAASGPTPDRGAAR